MVKLNRIYTRTGDGGTTGLANGPRRPKFDLRVAAYGTVDETNAAIGLARLHTSDDAALDAILARIQNDLFDLGADLCTPEVDDNAEAQAAYLHLARTICRRAERLIVELAGCPGETLSPIVLQYVNRLSDLLFVAARHANAQAGGDVLWKPGQNR
ncbi:MAG: ATP:cob(I)alamin adenosyltransferase [Rhizobiales bacterium]|nr:ATP:cob(I)alamin adenosyltransferase [Hyphomicrobiales bacterium]